MGSAASVECTFEIRLSIAIGCTRSSKTMQGSQCRERVGPTFAVAPRHLSRQAAASHETWGRRGLDVVCQGGGLAEFLMTDDAVGESWRPEIGCTDRVGLTCLSVRCLSSYLIFPPVPVTSSCGQSSLREMLRREVLHKKVHPSSHHWFVKPILDEST